MGITDMVFGTPGQTTVHQTPGTRDPGYNFAKWLFGQLPGLAQSPFPTYGGQIDPGLSPTMMDVIRRAQGYGQSGTPGVLSDVQGSLGRFMSPSFQNPWNSLFGGSPNYGGVNPNTRVYGGAPAGDMTYQGMFQPQQAGNAGRGTPLPPGSPPQRPMPLGPEQMYQSRMGIGPWAAWGPESGGSSPSGGAPGGINQSPMTGPPTASTPSFNSMPSPAASMPGYNPAFSGTTDPAIFNSPEFVAWNKQFQNKPFHSTDYQSAWEQLNPGQTMSEADRIAAWMKGDTQMIEDARKSFQTAAGGVGQETWSPAQRRMNELINQYGLTAGSKMFNDEVNSGKISMGPVPGAPPPPPGAAPPPPPPGSDASRGGISVGGPTGGPSTGAGGGAPMAGVTPGTTPFTRTGSPFGPGGGGTGTGSDADRVMTGPPTTAPPGAPRRGEMARKRFQEFMGGIPKQYRQGSPLDYANSLIKPNVDPMIPQGSAATNWRDYWRQTIGRGPRKPPGTPPGPTDTPITKPVPPGRRQRPGGGS